MTVFSQRRSRLKRKLHADGPQGMLVTNPVNVTYLTGFTGDSSYLLMSRDRDLFLTDTRFEEQISEEAPDLEAHVRDSRVTMTDLVSKQVASLKVSSLALEATHLSFHDWKSLAKPLGKVELVATAGWIEELRAIKDRDEIASIRRAIQLAERTFDVIRTSLRAEQTERELAHAIEHQIRLFGGTECAFEPIVGVGPRAALPHAIPTNRTVGESPFTLFDWGARTEGYTSDLTRVLLTGKLTKKFETIYNTVLEAQLAAIATIRPGVATSEVDSAARSIIAKAGHEKHFGHGLGHGFGLEIHENPRMSPMSSDILKPGMVVTVEPGIYLPGWGGVRIEDDILVTKEGHEVLTSVPKILEETTVPHLL